MQRYSMRLLRGPSETDVPASRQLLLRRAAASGAGRRACTATRPPGVGQTRCTSMRLTGTYKWLCSHLLRSLRAWLAEGSSRLWACGAGHPRASHRWEGR